MSSPDDSRPPRVRDIAVRRSGVYEATPEEEAAIREGLAQLDRNEWIDEAEMKVFWARCGVR